MRVVSALGELVMGKVINVQMPYIFKQIIDKLNGCGVLSSSDAQTMI